MIASILQSRQKHLVLTQLIIGSLKVLACALQFALILDFARLIFCYQALQLLDLSLFSGLDFSRGGCLRQGNSPRGFRSYSIKALPLTRSIPAPMQIVIANATNNAVYCFFIFLLAISDNALR